MRQSVLIAAGVFITALTTALPASAQLSEGGGPVSYSSDNLEYFDAEHRLVLTGDVDIVQADARLRADRITLFFSQSTSGDGQNAPAAGGGSSGGGLGAGDIQRMIAEGEVYYVRPAQSARGNRAVYEVAQDSVTFSGNVVVASDENVIRGETLVLRIGSRQTVVRPQGGGRVRGVFVPSEDGQNRPAQPQNR